MNVLPRAYFHRARCCRDDAGLRVSHIYVVCAPPADAVYAETRVESVRSPPPLRSISRHLCGIGCGVRRVECARPVGVPWPRRGGGGQVAVAAVRPRPHGGAEARRGASGPRWPRRGPGLGREREMPDAARAAALSRRAYEAATGRCLGGVGTVSPVKRLGAWGLCGLCAAVGRGRCVRCGR